MYDANAKIIGSIDDENYREKIIQVYVKLKRLADAIATYSDYYEKWLGQISSDPNRTEVLNLRRCFLEKEKLHLKHFVYEIASEIKEYGQLHEDYIKRIKEDGGTPSS